MLVYVCQLIKKLADIQSLFLSDEETAVSKRLRIFPHFLLQAHRHCTKINLHQEHVDIQSSPFPRHLFFNISVNRCCDFHTLG